MIYVLKKAPGPAKIRATATLTATITAPPSQHTTGAPGPNASITFLFSILGFSFWRLVAWLQHSIMAKVDAGHAWQQQVIELAMDIAQLRPWSEGEVLEAVVRRK